MKKYILGATRWPFFGYTFFFNACSTDVRLFIIVCSFLVLRKPEKSDRRISRTLVRSWQLGVGRQVHSVPVVFWFSFSTLGRLCGLENVTVNLEVSKKMVQIDFDPFKRTDSPWKIKDRLKGNNRKWRGKPGTTLYLKPWRRQRQVEVPSLPLAISYYIWLTHGKDNWIFKTLLLLINTSTNILLPCCIFSFTDWH